MDQVEGVLTPGFKRRTAEAWSFFLMLAAGLVLLPSKPAVALAVFALALALAVAHWKISRGAAVTVFLASVLLGSANYRLSAPVPIDLTADRIALVLLAVAWASGSLEVRTQWPAEARRFNRPLLLIATISLLTLLVNFGEYGRQALLMTGMKRLVVFFTFVLVYSVIVALVRDRAEVEKVVRALVVLGTTAALFGVIERLTRVNPLVKLQAMGPFEQYRDMSAILRGGGVRIYGTAGHPIEFGAAMALLLPLAVYLFMSAKRGRDVALYLACAPAIGLAMIFSVSRSSLIAVAVGLLVLVALSRSRFVAVTAVAAGVIWVQSAFPRITRDFFVMLNPQWIIQHEAGSFSGRMNDWPRIWDIFTSSPIVGVGLGMFDAQKYFYVDNQYLTFVVEIGIFGLLAALYLFGTVIVSLFRGALASRSREKVPLEAGLLASVSSYVVLSALFDTFGFGQVTAIFFVLVGLALVLTTDDGRVQETEVPAWASSA